LSSSNGTYIIKKGFNTEVRSRKEHLPQIWGIYTPLQEMTLRTH